MTTSTRMPSRSASPARPGTAAARRCAVAVIFASTLLASAAFAQDAGGILTSAHNLSAAGGAQVRAVSEAEVCIFCHTPHGSAPIQPLWNRHVPVNAYTVYSSSSLDAIPGQPTGSSKLCLSCHDGTIALGSVLSRGQTVAMAGGITTLPPGQNNLGTDLSDDHPVSFRYDAALAARDTKLKDPGNLGSSVKLDMRRELQCTSCHDAHNNQFGKFLVMDNSASQLCNTCHSRTNAGIPGHVQCASCHKPHTAPSGPFLLTGQTVSATCLSCHSGQAARPAGANIAADLNKLSRHDTNPSVRIPPTPADVTCNDCHEPHTMQAMTAQPPFISPRLGQVAGLNASGAVIPRAQYEFEVCFKCHAAGAATPARISRQVSQTDTRLEFSPSAISFHPVEAHGKSTDVPSLRPPMTTSSLIYCTSCHASDSGKSAGGAGAAGAHGSNVVPLLLSRYDTVDFTSESANAYALCYRCHDRSSILANQSFRYHKKHVVGARTPCSVCHDAHGISSAQGTATRNAHLINFDIGVVQPDPVTHRLEYVSQGPRRGACYLTCHGKRHSPKSY